MACTIISTETALTVWTLGAELLLSAPLFFDLVITILLRLGDDILLRPKAWQAAAGRCIGGSTGILRTPYACHIEGKAVEGCQRGRTEGACAAAVDISCQCFPCKLAGTGSSVTNKAVVVVASRAAGAVNAVGDLVTVVIILGAGKEGAG